MEFNPYLAQLLATGKYTTVGAALTTTFARGCALVRTGVGVTTATLDRQADAAERVTQMTAITDSIYCSHADTSDTVVTLKSWDNAGMAAEAALNFNIWRCTGGAGR